MTKLSNIWQTISKGPDGNTGTHGPCSKNKNPKIDNVETNLTSI